MNEYKVIWEIDIDAESAEEAARKALAIMRDPESRATVFEVIKLLAYGEEVEPWKYSPERIDPTEIDEDEPNILCYDNGGETFDRYTVVYMDCPDVGGYQCLGMSENPTHPQGFGQHSVAVPGDHLGKVVELADLPEACQELVARDLKAWEENEEVASILEDLAEQLRSEVVKYKTLLDANGNTVGTASFKGVK